jgi:hypothetical protein
MAAGGPMTEAPGVAAYHQWVAVTNLRC